jgi:uncharacterized protein (TIGR02246 family)
MRAFICLLAIGVVVTALCSSPADDRDVKKVGPATAGKSSKEKSPRTADKNNPESDRAQPARDADREKGDDNPAALSRDGEERSREYGAEEEAILKTGLSFVKAYADHDAKAVAAHFAPDAEYVTEHGELFRGGSEIEASLENFFKEHPKAQLALHVESLRFLSPVLAIEDGKTTCTCSDASGSESSRYTAIHAKADGQWLVASVREHGIEGKRLHSLHVGQLNWLIGNWVDEDEDSVVRFNCQLTDGGNFLVREFEVSIAGHKVISGTQRTGWDPVSGNLRAWTFDSEGGYFDGTWHRDGDRWILTSTGVTADGHSASGTSIFTPINDRTITWQAVDRGLDESRIEDSEEFTLVRIGPAPQLSDETDAR